MPRILRRPIAVLLATSLASCGLGNSVQTLVLGNPNAPKAEPHLSGFIGGVAADEPRAALVARDILATGGNAADAAVAAGFMLTVTLPSRASLGGGGACLAYQPGSDSPHKGGPEAILFNPVAPPGPPSGDRPAAIPMLARGLFLLHARYGSARFETLIGPAEDAAHFGQPVSRALANDLAVVAGPLLADPGARAIFAGPDGTVLHEGDKLVQGDLGSTLAAMRTLGVGDMYQGLLAHRIVSSYAIEGGPVTLDDLRQSLARLAEPIVLGRGNDKLAFLPPPADGGLAAAAAIQVLQSGGDVAAAGARAQAVSAYWRTHGGDPATILDATTSAPALPPLPASTSFVVIDRMGDAVACALTNENLFGTGRVAPGTGIIMAASPAAAPPAMLAAGIAWNANLRAFRAAVASSGQNAAGLATAMALQGALSGPAAMPSPVPEPGRANAITCPGYVPGAERECRWATDPRGSGLAMGGN